MMLEVKASTHEHIGDNSVVVFKFPDIFESKTDTSLELVRFLDTGLAMEE